MCLMNCFLAIRRSCCYIYFSIIIIIMFYMFINYFHNIRHEAERVSGKAIDFIHGCVPLGPVKLARDKSEAARGGPVCEIVLRLNTCSLLDIMFFA